MLCIILWWVNFTISENSSFLFRSKTLSVLTHITSTKQKQIIQAEPFGPRCYQKHVSLVWIRRTKTLWFKSVHLHTKNTMFVKIIKIPHYPSILHNLPPFMVGFQSVLDPVCLIQPVLDNSNYKMAILLHLLLLRALQEASKLQVTRLLSCLPGLSCIQFFMFYVFWCL